MSILILDTESTGLNEPQVNELGYVKVDSLETLEVLDTFEQRYKPDKPSELGALMTHNILDSELVDCSSYLTASLPIETTYVIGHNIDYDMGVLNLTNADIKRICTKALASYFLPELDSHRQSALLYYFEGDEARAKLLQAHSALPDVMNCRLLLGHLLDLICDKFPKIPRADLTIEQLYAISEEARIPVVMPFGKHRGEYIKDIPLGYKSWLLKQPDVDPYLVKALKG